MIKVILSFDGKELGNFEIGDKGLLVGREADCDIKVENIGVSRHHAKFENQNGIYIITDLDSNNGTYVNGKKIKKHNLNPGDEVIIGKHLLTFVDTKIQAEQAAKTEDKHKEMYQGVNTMAVSSSEIDKVIKKQTLVKKRAFLKVLTESKQEQVLPIAKMMMFVGKNNNCDIRLFGSFVSDYQALIHYDDEKYMIYYLGGWRTLFINGRPIDKSHKHVLNHNDIITIGPNRLIFSQEASK